MKYLKNRFNFINENVSIYKGNFDVTSDMVSNGKMIEDMIPREVTGYFACSANQLTTLEGSPEYVGGSFWCEDNNLTNLEGSPKLINTHFFCNNNLLTSLEGSPEEVGVDFYCHNNQLSSLEGGPKSVGGEFDCYNNQLSSLEGGPKSVGGEFDCYNNQLISLEGLPKGFNNDMITDLEIEKDFVKSSGYKENYWMDLLKYMISNSIELTKVHGWPKVFIDSLEPKYRNILISTKGINKFKL